jgi:hypothetical protein
LSVHHWALGGALLLRGMAYAASVSQLNTDDSAAQEEELLDSAEHGRTHWYGQESPRVSRRHVFLPVLVLVAAGATVAAIRANPRPTQLSTDVGTAGGYLSAEMLLASSDLRGAVTEALLKGKEDGGDPRQRQAVRALVDTGFQEFGTRERLLSRRGAAASPPFLTQAQKDALVDQARSLAAGDFTIWGRGGDRGIYRFGSADAGRMGTGSLGEPGEDEDSASEVVLSTSSLPARKIRFTVGPPLGSSGMFLVDGTMTVTDQSANRTSGNITVGFVNLHSTLSGLWWAHGNSSELGKTKLHVSLRGMSPKEDEAWTWRPVVATLNHEHADDASVDSVEVDDHVTCSDPGENCTSTRCCNAMDLFCYYKDADWAGCRPSCQFDKPAPGFLGVWWCQDLTSHRKNTQLLLKRGFMAGTRVRAYFEGAWYTGTVVLEPDTGSCDNRRHPLQCDRRLEWKIRCESNKSIQYFFTNRMKALHK